MLDAQGARIGRDLVCTLYSLHPALGTLMVGGDLSRCASARVRARCRCWL